jgi:hypothetical protein
MLKITNESENDEDDNESDNDMKERKANGGIRIGVHKALLVRQFEQRGR